MASVVESVLDSRIVGHGFSHKVPWLTIAFAVDEGKSHAPFELSDGATAVSVPGIGAGGADITTIQYFLIVSYGVVTLNFNGANFVLSGTASVPAKFEVGLTSTTTVPTLSNSSGSTVTGFILVGGT